MADKDNIVPIGGNSSEPPQVGAPEDARDYESLWLDPALGDGIVDVHYHKVTVDKPKDFFRTHPEKGYRRRGVAGVYNRSPYEREVRAALALWAEHVAAIVEGRMRVVVPLKRDVGSMS